MITIFLRKFLTRYKFKNHLIEFTLVKSSLTSQLEVF